jgi:hypothetical protein
MDEWISPSTEEADACFDRCVEVALAALGDDFNKQTTRMIAMRICDARAAATAVRETEGAAFVAKHGRPKVHAFYHDDMHAVAEAITRLPSVSFDALVGFARVFSMCSLYSTIEGHADDDTAFGDHLSDKVKAWFQP